MFRRRALTHYSSSIRTINQGLSGLAYRTKWLVVVLILSLLSLTQLPEIFAQEMTQQASAVNAKIKRQRVINLYDSSQSGSILTGSIVEPQKNNTNHTNGESGIVVSYSGTGSCVWDMAAMQWTGIQTHTGAIGRSQWTGSRSGFDSQTMGLSYGTGILLHQALVDSGNYLIVRECNRLTGHITYPGDQEYLSGLILFSGELLDLPPVFSGVKLIINRGSGIVSQGVNKQFGSKESGGIRNREAAGSLVSHISGGIIGQKGTYHVSSRQEFAQLIDQGAGIIQKQQTKRPRDSGKANKLQIVRDIIYTDVNGSLSTTIDSGTVLFTAQGQELKIDQFVTEEIIKDRNPRSIFAPTSIEMGTPGDHLIFTQPVMITYQSDLPDGSPVMIQVQHAGQSRSTQGLSTNPNTTCDLDGNANKPGSTTSVQGGQIRFYTCGASVFTFTYTGGANTGNFVDNGSLTKTVTIATGSVSTGFVISDINVLINWQAIDSENPLSFGNTNSFPSQKSFTITSPGGVTRRLISTGTYADGTATGVITILDDQAGALPSGLPVSGRFLPRDSLNNVYSNTNPIGIWTLTMADNTANDGVILHGFTIQIADIECGDRVIAGGEQCDDGDLNDGDGCSNTCQVEQGRQCSGQPSSCILLPAPIGLRFHLDGSKTGALFRDIAGSGFNATEFNGVTTGNQNGETIMCFNGTNQYLERATNFVTAYPFTMSVWMKSSSITRTAGVMSFARFSSTSRMWNIEHINATGRQNAQNSTATYTNASTTLNTTQWFLVTAVYASATSRTIYVNGVAVGTSATTVNYSSNIDNRLNIGRFANSTANNYFTGCVDDVRLYANTLSSGQVYNLYTKPASLTTSLVTVGSPLLTGTILGVLDSIRLAISGTNYTGTNNGNGTWTLAAGTISPALVNDTYVTTMLVTNPYGRAVTYTGSFVVSIPPPTPTGTICIESPSVLSLSGSADNTGNILEYQFDYFSVTDTKGINSGYYTTLSLPTLTKSGGGTLSNTAIQWRGDTMTLLSGSANPRVVVATGMQAYTGANTTVTFVKRDTAANSSLIGQYGSKLWLKVTVPPYQVIGTYTGTITYTLYEN